MSAMGGICPMRWWPTNPRVQALRMYEYTEKFFIYVREGIVHAD